MLSGHDATDPASCRTSLVTEAVASPSDGSTHGFLFADLRGYTHLVDTRGAVEASYLLGRYRAIVREVVTHHGGAEIKTEGDSFYVVLPSASAALRCGLDILKSCMEPADGGEAIKLGIGIHAGESVAHEGGFVGSAINIAARICALASAGEVLVSGTIRELTRSIVTAEFVFVGRRQLKGLDQPVEVFSVVADGARSSVRRRSAATARRPLALLALAAIAIAGVGTGAAFAFGFRPIAWLSGTPGASSEPSTSQLASSPSVVIEQLPEVRQVVPPGTYMPNHNLDVASVTVSKEVSQSHWSVAVDAVDVLWFQKPSPPAGSAGVALARITVVYAGGCASDQRPIIGDRPQDLINWVRLAPQFDPSEPSSVVDLGRSGIGIEATVLAPPAGTCKDQPSGTNSVFLWGLGGSPYALRAGSRILFEALEDGARTLTVVFEADNATELASEHDASVELLKSMVLQK
jgi:class 3 adenylate cyclase